jgi:two-component system response regulator PilR (NtrC family)
MTMDKILVVDDELSMREFLEILLDKQGYLVETAANGEEALQKLDAGDYDLVICDIMMPRVNGMEVLRKTRERDRGALVIMITAFASTESAVEAMKIGAYDYITKPFQVDEIKLVVAKALEKARLVRDNIRLQKEVESRYMFENLVGASAQIQQVFDLIRHVAPTRSNVLVLGESGTGKELVARAIHFNSPRRDQPFVTVNCGAIPAELLESELFGHKKGAFTGAYADKRGLFEAANQGTVFLDEIGEAPLAIQVKLLRAIQDKTFKPVGGLQDVLVDARIVSASNRDLEAAVKTGSFREDLYYRLNVISILIPPLRDRREDITLLVRHFLARYAREVGKEIRGISADAERVLIDYDWPGNVRELENTIERAISLTHTDVIAVEDLSDKVRCGRDILAGLPGLSLIRSGQSLETLLQDTEKKLIEEALASTGGVKKKAADILGISFRSFRYRLEKLGMESGKDEDAEN